MSNANSLNHGQLVSIEPLLNPDKAEIESLRAKVAELEAENARLKEYEGYVEACSEQISGNGLLAVKINRILMQLTAEQSKVKVLTDAINHVVTNGLGNHSIVTLMQALATVKDGK